MSVSLSIEVLQLFEQQCEKWPLLALNYNALSQVQTKCFDINGFVFDVQFNPARIISTTAKVDEGSISSRRCFLCRENRPDEQLGVKYCAQSGNCYEILINPFPIAPHHLTIVADHVPQRIMRRIDDMVELAYQLDNFAIFYNGPQCGASAPDHMHFQGCNKDFLKVLSRFSNFEDNISEGVGEILDYPATTMIFSGRLKEHIIDDFLKFYFKFSELSQTVNEPMLNLLCWFTEGKYYLIAFSRKAHRPMQFFTEDESNLLISPASIDLAGVVIAPVEKDFMKITADDIKDIMNQISVDQSIFDELIYNFKRC